MRKTRCILGLILLAAMASTIGCAQQVISPDIPSRTQAESDYINRSDSIWTLFWEDLSQGSYILDRYAAGNMTAGDALSQTVSTYTLCSHTVDMIENDTPPQKFRDFHNLTVLSVLALRAHLWSMAKYYETANIISWCQERYRKTDKKTYLTQASYYQRLNAEHYRAMSNYFNQTVDFLNAAKKERIKAVEF